MKQFVCMVCAAVSLFGSALAQSPTLQITTDKTTSLVFPYPIKHVDRGSRDILVQPVQEADSVLLVKAAVKDFASTNISVVTGDGSVYAFAVRYGEPSVWVYHFAAQQKTSVSAYARTIVDNPRTMHGIKDASWDMVARVIGIYIKDDVIYCQLDLQNQSPIDYDIDFLRFYIRDQKKSKRTAVQENELLPLYTVGNISQVKADAHHAVVVALEKFTIPDAKYLAIEIGEKNGGRNLLMKVHNRKLLQAIPLPDLK
ncbi:MAG: conjugative transposon protein TraN [Flavisolibacter sp.]